MLKIYWNYMPLVDCRTRLWSFTFSAVSKVITNLVHVHNVLFGEHCILETLFAELLAHCLLCLHPPLSRTGLPCNCVLSLVYPNPAACTVLPSCPIVRKGWGNPCTRMWGPLNHCDLHCPHLSSPCPIFILLRSIQVRDRKCFPAPVSLKLAHTCIITNSEWRQVLEKKRREKKRETEDYCMNKRLWGEKSKEKLRQKKSFSALKKKYFISEKMLTIERGVERDKWRESTTPNEGSRLLVDSCNELHSILLICTIAVHLAKSLSGLHESGEEYPSLVTLNWAP